jgi:hypothetical protein
MSEPLQIWWDALERGGFGPHGQPRDFRARCPLHNGDNDTSLHVFEGADGRAVPHCFSCLGHPKDIAAAVGLGPWDSFPAGHRQAHRKHLPTARRTDFSGNARLTANVLLALERAGSDYRAEFLCDCPYCGEPHARLIVPRDREAVLFCRGGCDVRAFADALADLVIA